MEFPNRKSHAKKIMERVKEKFMVPFWNFLKQGITPKKLAITIALGIVLGAFPLIGSTTALCAIAAIVFRLNVGVLQFINYITYPIQIFCLIPLYQLGAYIFNDKPFTINIYELKEKISSGWIKTLIELWEATWHAMVAWTLLSIPATFFIFIVIFPLLKKIKIKQVSPQPLP